MDVGAVGVGVILGPRQLDLCREVTFLLQIAIGCGWWPCSARAVVTLAVSNGRTASPRQGVGDSMLQSCV